MSSMLVVGCFIHQGGESGQIFHQNQALGIPVGPLNDKKTVNMPLSQVSTEKYPGRLEYIGDEILPSYPVISGWASFRGSGEVLYFLTLEVKRMFHCNSMLTNGELFWAMKKGPWLFRGFVGDEILPSYVGISRLVINHYCI